MGNDRVKLTKCDKFERGEKCHYGTKALYISDQCCTEFNIYYFILYLF